MGETGKGPLMSKVAIIGSGFVGRAWAISFARGGHEVALWDAGPAAPRPRRSAYIERLLPDLVANDLLNGAAADDGSRARMRGADLASALAGAVHVQENTPEDVAGQTQDLRAARRRSPLPTPCWRARPPRSCPRPSRKLLGPRALSRRPSDQPALSHSGGRGRAGAVDRSRRWSSARPPSCALRAMRPSS